jgi:hypothetical protein
MKDKTIREKTFIHIIEVGQLISTIMAHLSDRCYTHDMSKFDSEDINSYVVIAEELHKVEYGSPEYKEILSKYMPHIEMHYKKNRHHPQYFEDGISGMNLVDLCEMICDWVSSIKKNEKGNILNSIEFGQKRFGYSDDLKQIMINTVKEYFPECLKN